MLDTISSAASISLDVSQPGVTIALAAAENNVVTADREHRRRRFEYREDVSHALLSGEQIRALDGLQNWRSMYDEIETRFRTADFATGLEPAVADTAGRYLDMIQVEADSHLVLPEGSAAQFGNHSCDPNLWYGGEFVLSARRDIARNDEATVDYATLSVVSGFSMECQCGASSCRRKGTGDDWRLHHLPERYGVHRTSAALALIASPR